MFELSAKIHKVSLPRWLYDDLLKSAARENCSPEKLLALACAHFLVQHQESNLLIYFPAEPKPLPPSPSLGLTLGNILFHAGSIIEHDATEIRGGIERNIKIKVDIRKTRQQAKARNKALKDVVLNIYCDPNDDLMERFSQIARNSEIPINSLFVNATMLHLGLNVNSSMNYSSSALNEYYHQRRYEILNHYVNSSPVELHKMLSLGNEDSRATLDGRDSWQKRELSTPHTFRHIRD